MVRTQYAERWEHDMTLWDMLCMGLLDSVTNAKWNIKYLRAACIIYYHSLQYQTGHVGVRETMNLRKRRKEKKTWQTFWIINARVQILNVFPKRFVLVVVILRVVVVLRLWLVTVAVVLYLVWLLFNVRTVRCLFFGIPWYLTSVGSLPVPHAPFVIPHVLQPPTHHHRAKACCSLCDLQTYVFTESPT